MQIRQSDLKTWQKCPLMYRYQNVDGIPREISGSLVFGSIIHDCVLWMEVNQDLEGAMARFRAAWRKGEFDGEKVEYYVRGTNWQKYMEKGQQVLERWWSIVQWETDLVLGREYPFHVPIGNGHTLHGTVDKLMVRYRAKTDEWVLLISDYKTNTKVPLYDYLEEDLQFSAYAYASLQPEFWQPMFPGDPARGLAMHAKYLDYPRYGEWVQLQGSKRMDAGIREERHYNRLIMACNAIADSVALRIFVPNISGESCRYCEYRKQCGLPELMEVDE